jgi:hypothetical protein
MEGFQKIVLFSAVVLLIIALVIIGMALMYSKNTSWPPMTPSCPDYWEIDGSGNDSTCINVKDLGTCPATSGSKHLVMDFNRPAFTGSQGLCNKYKWAKNCGVSWDSITYGINNPCQIAT